MIPREVDSDQIRHHQAHPNDGWGVTIPAYFHDVAPFRKGNLHAMNTREIIDQYYQTANAGEWEKWVELFSTDVVIDEQLAGHVEGVEILRGAIDGLRKGYSKFQNIPKHIIISDGEAAVFSHISAANASGAPIEAEVANYFQIRDGKIAYMANFHDTVPFKPFTEQNLE